MMKNGAQTLTINALSSAHAYTYRKHEKCDVAVMCLCAYVAYE